MRGMRDGVPLAVSVTSSRENRPVPKKRKGAKGTPVTSGQGRRSAPAKPSNAAIDHKEPRDKAQGLKGAIVVGVAAGSLLLSAFVREPLEEVLTGPAGTQAATVAWNLCSIIVGSAATLLLLVSHAEMRLARTGRRRGWADGRLVTDVLALIANAVLWAFVATFLVVRSPSDEIHVLDLLGQAASLGSIVGLGATTLWGARLYAQLLVSLSIARKLEALVILMIAAAAWPIIWY
jgi:hypothetical protein